MNDRFFLSFVAGVGVLLGAGYASRTLPLPPSDAVVILAIAIAMTAIVYVSIPLAVDADR